MLKSSNPQILKSAHMPQIHNARLDHVSYVVPDLDAAVQFFVQYFGFQVIAQDEPVQSATDDRITRQYAMPERAVGRFAMLQFGGQQIELAEWKTFGQALNPLRESTVPGCHIALRVPDVDLAMKRLKSISRMRFLEVVENGSVLCFTPFGFQLQLVREQVLG